jgi:hypothetical protein
MSRRFCFSALMAASLLALVLVASASGSPVAQTAKTCGVGEGHGFGYSYLTSLTVQRTSCKNGRHVVHKRGKLRGWHCSKKRLDTSPVQYDERVTCKSGRRLVKWTFTQNTS